MATISDERVGEITKITSQDLSPVTEEECEAMAQELMTARSYIPAMQSDVARLTEDNLTLKGKNYNLEQTARGYAEQQAKMIDMRQADAEQIQRLMRDITEGAARELKYADEIRELEAALRAIRDELRCLTAVLSHQK